MRRRSVPEVSRRLAATRIAAALLALLVPAAGLCGEGLSTDNPFLVKAAYLVNFAKYVAWPAGAFASTNAPIRITVVGRNPFGDSLDDLVRGRLVQHRPIEIRRATDLEDLGDCHILYIGGMDREREAEILAAVRDRPVLTVGEDRDFLDRGGMIRFFIQRKSVLFDVHLARAGHAGLEIHARMLETASRVLRGQEPGAGGR